MGVSEPMFVATAGIAIILAYAWLRSGTRHANQRRTQQLNHAAVLLSRHADALEHFLLDVNAPRHMKRFLLDWSDAMGEEAEVLSMVAAMDSQGTWSPKMVSAEASALRADLDDLGRHHPALAKAFETALRTGILAAILLWPFSASLFESAVTNVKAEPERELKIAVATAKHRAGLRVSLSASGAAA
jgi:hypothetical protein